MTPEIKDEWVEAGCSAYTNTGDYLDSHRTAMRSAIEAIAPAIYEAGLRAGLAQSGGYVTTGEGGSIEAKGCTFTTTRSDVWADVSDLDDD